MRICLVGAGRAGRVHAESISRHVAASTLAAVVDTDPGMLRAVADEFGVEGQFSTLEAALEREKFDAVIITTPTFTHTELAVMAARAGKHIFLEKPMALTLQQCDEIIATTSREGVLLQLGFMRRFQPEFELAAERIAAGEIGRPMMIKSLTHGPGLPPTWARSLQTSNGLLAEVNSHDWDCVRWYMGANPERVYVEVSNLKGKARGVSESDFYDTALTLIRFENDGLGMISGVCPCDYGYDARLEIVGEKGIMQVGDLRGRAIAVCVDAEQGTVSPMFRSWRERFAVGYVREMQHFVDAVRTGSPPRVGGEEGRWAVVGVLASTRSFLERRPVQVSEILSEVKVDPQ